MRYFLSYAGVSYFAKGFKPSDIFAPVSCEYVETTSKPPPDHPRSKQDGRKMESYVCFSNLTALFGNTAKKKCVLETRAFTDVDREVCILAPPSDHTWLYINSYQL